MSLPSPLLPPACPHPREAAPASSAVPLTDPTGSLHAFLAELLADQQHLQTPVSRYSAHHDHAAVTGPALAPVYRDLIPLSRPQAGEQYAFEVDLDACSGCKACVAACHSLNGLDETEAWRDVGLVVGGEANHPFQQTITSACHHCADPGCLNGCPVLAYEKDPITGIVRHLDDQCIGCSYCILKCPYDVPKYSKRLGIVRKCDMCHGRLVDGEAPACVQACPTHAIRIVTVPVAHHGARSVADTSHFLPSAPEPSITQPTTRYISRRPWPRDVRAAEVNAPAAEPAHTPLAVMLVLTQLAVGIQVGAAPSGAAGLLGGAGALSAAELGWLCAAAGLAASVFHLGRPARAWRIFLGLRRSWLSREAVAFGGWFAAATVWVVPVPIPFATAATVALGLLGVACSAMIYVDTGRRDWRVSATFPRFFGTVLVAALAVSTPVLAGAALLGKLAWEVGYLQRSSLRQRRLVRGPLWRLTAARFLLGTWAGVLLLGTLHFGAGALACACILFGVAELLERSAYFQAVNPSRMPGALSS